MHFPRIRVLLVDDEPLALEGMREILARDPEVKVVGECADGAEAVDALRARPADLVLLDVRMPELDGFGVIRAVGPDRMPEVVFVTAFDDFAVRAFEVNAVDYLLKPFDDSRVNAAVDRVLAQIDRESGAATQRARLAFSALAAGKEKTYLRRLALPRGERSEIIRVERIDRIEAEGKYVRIWSGDRSHLLRRPISLMADILDPAMFVRVSRSAIVNLERISEIIQPTARQCYVALENGVRIRVTRGYQSVVDRLMFDLE